MIGRVHGDAPDRTARDWSDVDNVADALHPSMTREPLPSELAGQPENRVWGGPRTTYFGPQSRPF